MKSGYKSDPCPRCGIIADKLVPLKDNGKGPKICRQCKRQKRGRIKHEQHAKIQGAHTVIHPGDAL